MPPNNSIPAPTPARLNPDVSPGKSFFLGEIATSNLFPFPSLREEERETLGMVVQSVTRFMEGRGEEYREFDRVGEQPERYLAELKELGLFGLIIPEEFGGIGLSNLGYSRALQQACRFDGSTSLTIGAHSSIGMKGVLLFGTPEQKAKYLPRLASGALIAAFCLTEPGSGSDAASITTSATKNPDGSWTLNGEKIWITNGAFADFFTVFARSSSEQGKITAFLVERTFGGITSGKKEDKMGIRASATTSVIFQNTRVPAENVLGAEGHGFKVAMGILNNGRTGLGGGCVGGMKRMLELASRQAAERKQFGRPISSFQLIQEKIAQMTVNCFVTESVVTMVAHYIDSGVKDYSVEAAIAKILASENLWWSANEALQIAGGNGYMREYPYERTVRDSRINLIFEGTNEILRLYIGLSGLKEAGEYLKEIGKSAKHIFDDPIKGFGVLSGYAQKRISRQVARVGRRDSIEEVHPILTEEGAIMKYYAVWLSRAVDAVLRKYGKEIIGRQFVTRRLANVAIDLFAGTCVLSRISGLLEAKGEGACQDELRIAKLFSHQAKRRMNDNLRKIEREDDTWMTELADSIVKEGGYRWDIL